MQVGKKSGAAGIAFQKRIGEKNRVLTTHRWQSQFIGIGHRVVSSWSGERVSQPTRRKGKTSLPGTRATGCCANERSRKIWRSIRKVLRTGQRDDGNVTSQRGPGERKTAAVPRRAASAP